MPARRPDARFFHAAVQSILEQTAADLELIVVETEGEHAAAELLQRFDDRRIRYISAPNGISAALNAGIAAARADLVARIDADDIAMPGRIAEQIALFDREPELAAAGTQCSIIDEEGRAIGMRRYPTEPHDIARTLMRYNCICHPSVMFRRNAVADAGGYRDGLNEDYDLWCRLSVRGAIMRNHPAPLVAYRFHAGAMTRVDVRGVIRSGIEIKRRVFGAKLDLRARARIAAEYALLALPRRIVIAFFRLLHYTPR